MFVSVVSVSSRHINAIMSKRILSSSRAITRTATRHRVGMIRPPPAYKSCWLDGKRTSTTIIPTTSTPEPPVLSSAATLGTTATPAAIGSSAEQQSSAVTELDGLVHMESIAKQVGVRLTRNELVLLHKKMDLPTSDDGNSCPIAQQKDIEKISARALKKKARELCLSVICSPENPLDKWGVRVINFFDYFGTALFAVVGTQVAGDCGMNIVGCGLVGCVAAMGGGSLNAVLYGGASPLLAMKTGVRWVANPSYLVVAITASIITFFAWPYYCQTQALAYLEKVVGKEHNGLIGRDAFLDAWHRDENFQHTIRDALPTTTTTNNTPNKDESMISEGDVYFNRLDTDSSGDIDMEELERLVQRRFYNGWETYWLDTFALSSLSIAGVSGAVRLGLSPIVAATSGITVCFGGIFRDLLCGRDLAIGSQSYAFATGVSSTVYICLRELALRRICILPLVVRTFMAAGTCIGLRGYEFFTNETILRPMHGRKQQHS